MMSGMPWACATAAIAAMSKTSLRGFGIDSANSARVSGPMSASQAAGLFASSTKSVSMP